MRRIADTGQADAAILRDGARQRVPHRCRHRRSRCYGGVGRPASRPVAAARLFRQREQATRPCRRAGARGAAARTPLRARRGDGTAGRTTASSPRNRTPNASAARIRTSWRALGKLYADTVSHLRPRVMVQGQSALPGAGRHRVGDPCGPARRPAFGGAVAPARRQPVAISCSRRQADGGGDRERAGLKALDCRPGASGCASHAMLHPRSCDNRRRLRHNCRAERRCSFPASLSHSHGAPNGRLLRHPRHDSTSTASRTPIPASPSSASASTSRACPTR